jgi:acetyl esterase/lipase
MSQIFLMLVMLVAPVRTQVMQHRQTRAAGAWAPPVAGDVLRMSDVEYGRVGNRPLLLDLYQLRDAPAGAKPRPVVIWVHGGAWRAGSKNWLPPSGTMLVRKGFVVASVEYRFTQEAIFPAQINDVKCSVRFLRSHAKQYNIDPERIGAYGASAGGHLVALLGTDADDKSLEGTGGWPGASSRVQAVVDMFGPTDFLTILQQVKTPTAQADLVARSFFGGPMDAVHEIAREASPVTHVSADDPPFLVIHGSNDPVVPVAQSEEFVAALKKAGVEARLEVASGYGHGIHADKYERMIVDFFDQHLAKKTSH